MTIPEDDNDVHNDVHSEPSQRDLAEAIWNGDAAAVRALLEAGADPNRVEEYGEQMPLHQAAGWTEGDPSASERVMAELLAHGAEVNGLDPWGQTPLDCAFAGGSAPAVRLLLARGGRLCQWGGGADGDGASACLAVLTRGAAAVDELLDRGADLRAAHDGMGRTALHVAAQAGDEEAVRLLLARGAGDVHARMCREYEGESPCARQGQTPLHLAAGGAHAAAVRALLEGGADPNAPDGTACWGDESAPLHHATRAARGGKYRQERALETMRALLEAGANVHGHWRPLAPHEDRPEHPIWSGTPLSEAAWLGGEPEVRLLLGHGAGDLRSALLAALHSATVHAGNRCLPLLWDAGRRRLDPPLALVEALPYLNSPGLRTLLEGGEADPPRETDVDVNEPHPFPGEDPEGETPLLWLLRHLGEGFGPMGSRGVYEAHDRMDVVLLLRHGADPNARDESGRRPLDVLRERAETLSFCEALLRKAGAEGA